MPEPVPDTPERPPDRARMSIALVGFYTCCALVSLGAAMFFFAWFVMVRPQWGSLPAVMKVVGGALMLIGVPGCFVCLTKARSGAAT